MSIVVDKVMDLLHDQTLPSIELLQNSFSENKNFMMNISTLFDPRYVFLIYAPLLFAFSQRVGHRMIIALCLCEWCNQVLKWVLAGERPYWYVYERANGLNNRTNMTGSFQNNQPLIQIKQYPFTCELGAGSPSGHSMVTSTVWYILIDAYLRGELVLLGPNQARQPSGNKLATNKLTTIFWSLYAIQQLLLTVSRTYLACHFPHQCIGGSMMGAMLARTVTERVPIDRLRRRYFLYLASFMFVTALGTYVVLRGLGVDPLWSVDLGIRWCVKKEYIHLDTTPFFSMMRYIGFVVGAGLAYQSQNVQNVDEDPNSSKSHLLARRCATGLLSIAFAQFLLWLPAPKSNLNLFYVISFFMYTLISYAIVKPIPNLMSRLLVGSQPSATKVKDQ